MLSAKKLPLVLESQLNEGVEGITLLSTEGSILCSSFTLNSRVDEISLAAISTSVWSQYSQGKMLFHKFFCFLISFTLGINDPSLVMVRFEDDYYFGISIIQKSYLVAGYGRITPGLLRNKLQYLNQYFSKVFEQMKSS
jgi:hypothetical protein